MAWLAYFGLPSSSCSAKGYFYTRILLAAYKFRAWAASNSIFGIHDSDPDNDVVNKLMIRFRPGPLCLNYCGSFPFPPWEYLIFAFHRSVHQPVPLALGRFARVVLLDAGSAVGGSSRSSARFFWIS